MAKYRNKIIELFGKTFASQKEALRYAYLLEQQKAGTIQNLECQVKFTLIPKNEKFRELSYVADFVYDQDDRIIVEDVKPDNMKWYKSTSAYAVYNIKKKLMFHELGIEVQEV